MERAGKELTTCMNGRPTTRDLQEADALSKHMFMVSEYKFEHVCYQLSDSQCNETGFQFAFNLCRDFLRLRVRPEIGFTVLVTPKWMFVGVITQPYAKTA